jgi:small nuclear ribonucleoprotein (snRNP)-like protein
MIRSAKWILGVVAAFMFFSASLFLPMAGAQAKSVTPIEGVKFEVQNALGDNLKLFVGKDVHVHLRSGKTFQGYVKSVGDHFVHLEKLAGRDFYDVLIRIEDISAIEVKFRDLK